MFARSVTVTLLLVSLAWAGEAPVLSDAQKIKIREAQLEIANLQLQNYRIAEQYRQAMEKAAAALNEAVKLATPKGYTITPELKLVEEKDK